MTAQNSQLDAMQQEILSFIEGEFYSPMDRYHLTKVLALQPEQYDRFAEAVDELLRRGAICETQRGKLIAAARSGLLSGTFLATAHGYGFFRQDGASEDIFIPRDHMHGALHGDRVQIAITHGEKGKEGEVVRILERATEELVGTLHEVRDTHPIKNKKGKKVRASSAVRYLVKPDDSRYSLRIEVLPAQANGARDGDKVLVKITKYPSWHKSDKPYAMGKILRIFGESDSCEANYRAILYADGIRQRFDEKAFTEALKISPAISAEGRLDLRDQMIFTIDGADAKDFDDAISLTREENGYLLGVHIADVSHYVLPDSELDKEARLRGTSVYFANKVVPMLPETLTYDICSLNCGADRYALSVFLHFDEEGKLNRTDFYESVISSRLHGVYEEINDVWERKEASVYWEKYRGLFPDLFPMMVSLYEKLLLRSRARGSLQLETSETQILLDDEGMPREIFPRERGISERMIEQFMLVANEAAAEWLTSRSLPCLYRVHEAPPPEKVELFATFLHNLGLDMRPLKRRPLLPSAYCEICEEAHSRQLTPIVTPVMLRSLTKARYSAIAAPHFGLGCERYCHFTSPIRRYPDLAVHRLIKAALHGEMDEQRILSWEHDLHVAAEKSNEAELRALTAERDIEDLYKALYLSGKIGEEYEGIISSVTAFGLFVELANTCEGMIPIQTLPSRFVFDEAKRQLISGDCSYSLGQRVRIRIHAVSLSSRRLEFEWVESKEQGENS